MKNWQRKISTRLKYSGAIIEQHQWAEETAKRLTENFKKEQDEQTTRRKRKRIDWSSRAKN